MPTTITKETKPSSGDATWDNYPGTWDSSYPDTWENASTIKKEAKLSTSISNEAKPSTSITNETKP